MLAHVERDPVVIAASDVEIGCLHAAADVDPAQFARQIDPAVVDVDRPAQQVKYGGKRGCQCQKAQFSAAFPRFHAVQQQNGHAQRDERVAVKAAERQKRDNAHCAAREHAAEVAGFVPRITAALYNAVGEQRKRQPSDHAQPHRLRKKCRADVVNRHAHHGENLQLVLGQLFHARSPPLCINYSTPSGKGKGRFAPYPRRWAKRVDTYGFYPL